MSLEKLTVAAPGRPSFEAFANPLQSPLTGGGAHPLPAAFDAVERYQVNPLWSKLSLDVNRFKATAAVPPFMLPPETADQKRHRAQREIAAGAPSYGRVDGSISDVDLDARLAVMEADVSKRAGEYQVKALTSAISIFGRGNGLAKTYGDLAGAMQGDAAELANWRSLTRDQKIELHNRISREANIEVKYNVSIVYGDKRWSEQELIDLDAGLAKMPAALLLDDQNLNNIRRHSALKDGTNDVFAWALGNGDIEFTDLGVSATYRYPGTAGLTETIMHEVGHHFDDENPRWKEFMAISGWRDVGGSGDHASFANGTTVKGKDLGITDDPEGDFVISRQYGRTWVHSAGAEFGRGSYTQQNPLDDFAETFMQYMHDPQALKASAPNKFDFIKKFLADRGASYDPTLPPIE